MATKPTYDELEQKVKELEKESLERKQAEEALQASEVSYRTLAENLPGLVYRVFILENNRMHFFNDQLQSMTGYKEEELKKGSVCSIDPLILPEDMQKITTSVEEAIRKETHFEVEYRITHRDGDIRYFWERGRPILGGDGKSQYIDGTIFDITERKRAEEALRTSEAQLSNAMNIAQLGYWEYDVANDLFIFNDHFYAIFRTSAEQIGGYQMSSDRYARLFVHPDDMPVVRLEIQKAIESTDPNYSRQIEHRIIYADGGIGYISVRFFMVKDSQGRTVRTYGANQDITERKQAEEGLRKSEMLKNTIIETSPDSIKLLDLEGNLTYMSKGGQEKLEIKDITVYLNKNWADFWKGKDNINARIAIDTAVKGAIGNFQGYSPTETGMPRWWDVIISPIWGSNGEVEQLLAVSRDITEQKQMGDQLLQAQKMEAIGTLTGGIAHDYNNLMSIIMGNLSLAQEEAEPGSDLADLLNEIDIASSKVRDLTHELMSLSRGGGPVRKVGSLDEVLKNVSELIPADSGISLMESISQDLKSVPYDRLKLGAVIRNVVKNAVEAMPDGGTLKIKAENLGVEDAKQDSGLTLKPGDFIHISIQDQGKGIPEEQMHKIFDPYFSSKARGVQKGMGLGLSTAYAIIKQHGGHIHIDSSPDAGTNVNIYLPAESHPEQMDSAITSTDNKRSTVKRVLVMDDEEMLRKLVRQMLERMGYAVETVEDGLEAIEKYKKQKDSSEPFDAVILDLTIKGGMGGEQTMRELRKIDPDVKAIVSSGYFNDPVISDFKKYGFMDTLAKPYETKALKEVLERLSE